MNDKIPLKRLAEQLAVQAGVDNETAQAFLKSLFRIVTDSLLDGQSVTIAGLGTFSVSHNTAEPLRFEPEKQFSDDVNAPFAMFEAVILPDNVNVAEIDAVTYDAVTYAETGAPAETAPAEKPAEPVESGTDAAPEAPEEEETADENPVEPEPDATSDPEPQTTAETEATEDERPDNIIAVDIPETETAVSEQPVGPVADDNAEAEDAEDNVAKSAPDDQPDAVEEPDTEETKDSEEEIVSEPAAGNTPDEPQGVDPQGITYLPEVEEEYVDYHCRKVKSRFGLGFFLGLVTGLIIGALALVGYAVYFVKNGATLF